MTSAAYQAINVAAAELYQSIEAILRVQEVPLLTNTEVFEENEENEPFQDTRSPTSIFEHQGNDLLSLAMQGLFDDFPTLDLPVVVPNGCNDRELGLLMVLVSAVVRVLQRVRVMLLIRDPQLVQMVQLLSIIR